ncbi:hypothetical protein MPH_07511 [Macrophomina phaseolina MS6]|uniref:Uncharacterized protein n=1 Tax=Macrophomina phaseolina (strain MS6) TaxID=1126212 RepID=K2RYL4_MACPH|nr:hypothetical protein MPH_07511 [Macrophomina phaseolina MS6]
MIGYSAELLYLLAHLGRYCRLTMKTGVRDLTLEATYEEQLISWKPPGGDKTLVDMSYAYRNHGLIMLYKLREGSYRPETVMERWEESIGYSRIAYSIPRSLALDSLKRLFETPIDAPCIHFHSIPLLTAGAELSQDDVKLRVSVVARFKTLYSMNRVAVNIWAIELLEELWGLRDSGTLISWLELLLSKEWTLNFA